MAEREREIILRKGMPLGNLTSQFFANIYLNELDNFVKRKLQSKYYIRYVDDFVVLHNSKSQLEKWKKDIQNLLWQKLDLTLHPEKSKIIQLYRGTDFVGFRTFPHFKLLRKRNIKKIYRKVSLFSKGLVTYSSIMHSFVGWSGYALSANSFKLRKKILREIAKSKTFYTSSPQVKYGIRHKDSTQGLA